MAVDAVGATNTNQYGTTQETNASKNANVDYDTFLQLLVAQLKNQDPTDPSDPAAFLSQLASFSGVEQQIQMNTKLDSLLTGSQLGQATNLIGKTITFNGGTLNGVVSSVHLGGQGSLVAELANGTKVTIEEGVIISNE
ncbi:MAG: flagellar hook assembly protein FlgD [Rhizobiaceae bacterium]|nr:flagellar hook assembly protein FlgD [Rhizobiaceae bacterium]